LGKDLAFILAWLGKPPQRPGNPKGLPLGGPLFGKIPPKIFPVAVQTQKKFFSPGQFPLGGGVPPRGFPGDFKKFLTSPVFWENFWDGPGIFFYFNLGPWAPSLKRAFFPKPLKGAFLGDLGGKKPP